MTDSMHTHIVTPSMSWQGPQGECPWCRAGQTASTPAPVEAGPQWNKTTDGLPQKPGKRDYEQIECLIMLPNGDLEISVWNCEHLVWDDAEGDDFRHDPGYPTHWLALAPFRAALRAASIKLAIFQDGTGSPRMTAIAISSR